jgi:hypothetical protein
VPHDARIGRLWAATTAADQRRGHASAENSLKPWKVFVIAAAALGAAFGLLFHSYSVEQVAKERAARAPSVAAMLAEINEKREWRDIYFGCGIVDKHLGKSNRVGHYIKQFEAYGAVSSKPFLSNGKYWRQLAFDRTLLRGVPHSRFWSGDRFGIAFELADDAPDAIIEDCRAVLWVSFPYI